MTSSGSGIVIHARMPAITLPEGNPELRSCVKGQNQMIPPAKICYSPIRYKLGSCWERLWIPGSNNQW